ncbi:MAG TPA: hypothetical protein VFQ44_30735 [Streptosporangiaceae bacterium]|nr:hypothetical protein [Streptosporangiaceae bacterium]
MARRKGTGTSVAQQHAEWIGLLRPDGPFIAISVLTDVFGQGLDTVPGDVLDKLRLAWAEVREAPDLLTPAWIELVLGELLGYTPQILAEGGALPEDLRAGPASAGRLRPDAVAYGPNGDGGRAERLLIYRLPESMPLTKASRDEPSAAEQAAEFCKFRGTPLALLTNGSLWTLIHARPGEPATTAVFDADLWLEERELLRAFASLLHSRRVLPPPKNADGSHSTSLAGLFARSADAQAEVTNTLGVQVRQAVELLVGELSRLDREAAGTLLAHVVPREVYRGALTVMMRLVFLLYAEEQRLLPVSSDLYASAYSVAGLHDLLEAEQHLYGEEVGDRRAAAWPRLLATFAAVYDGCEYDEMRIPPYGGGLFDPAHYPWLDLLKVTDRVVHEILGALLVLRRRGGAAERLSYKGLDVEQIGHVYEGLLEYSCLRVDEPYLGLIGKLEPELPLVKIEQAAERSDTFPAWLAKECDASASAIAKALAKVPDDQASLYAACDNDAELAERVKPLSGLLRKDLRGLPTVFPAGSLVITQVGDRRATGTHYTPRKLAEEIVEHTLAPLCYSPGPADGAEPADWQPRPAAELLALKVLDPAMGSGAFLVSACRYLAERVVEAWDRDGYPDEVQAALGPDFDRDDAALEARRRVAARCLCGVDRDEAAVELGKLSLWLVTLAKDQPFSFLDHALRWGDSLVGLISEAQVEAFHLDPATGHRINARMCGAIDEITGPILTRVRELREEIAAEPVRDHHQATIAAAKLAEAERLTAKLREAADAVSAAALSTAGQPASAFDDRLTSLADQVQRLLEEDTIESPLEAELRGKLDAWLKGPRPEPIRPLHWPLEFPEVMQRGGFDAVVSNPPFIGGKKVSGALGIDYREYLKKQIARDRSGNADLCSYFLLRDMSVARRGRIGIIATNTIAQGDSREVGPDQAVDMGWVVYRADKSQPWPGAASLEVSLLWTGHPGNAEVCVLDGHRVESITPALDPASRVKGNPHKLATNSGQSFIGAYILGTGFILKPDEAQALIDKDAKNKAVVFPYLNGEDLNSRWDCSASRWVVDFNDWPLEKAMEYQEVFKIIDERVRPERQRTKPDGTYVLRKPLPQRWWQYADKRPALRKAISGANRVLVITQTSITQIPMLVSNNQIFSHKLVIFSDPSESELSFRTSSHQYCWTINRGSTMRTDAVFTPSDCCDTLVKPTFSEPMSIIGRELHEFRQEIMCRRKIGLTALYNLVHARATTEDDICHLREIHQEIDEAVREAYAIDEEREPEIREYESKVASTPLPSWREIELGHGFHETRQGVRFTISPQARVDVLDKLLALNHYRYEQEVKQGLHSGKGRGGTRKKGAARASGSGFDDGGLFPPDGTLF